MAVRKLYNFLSGALASTLSEGGQVIDFGQVIPVELFETEDGKEYVPLVISSDTTPEIVHLVEYEPGGTTGVVDRGKEGTEPVTHFAGSPWGCKPLAEDTLAPGGTVAVSNNGVAVIEHAPELNFGHGLRATPWRDAVRIDAEAAHQIIALESPTVAVSEDEFGNIVVTHTSRWGIDASGDPYYAEEGADSEDIAALVFYPGTREYALEWVSLTRTRVIGATVADDLVFEADPLQKFMGALHPATLEATLGHASDQGLDGRFDTDIVWSAEVVETAFEAHPAFAQPYLLDTFTTYPVGQHPDAWTERWGGAGTMEVLEGGGLEIDTTNTWSYTAWSWDLNVRANEFVDADIVMRLRSEGFGGDRSGPIVRMSGPTRHGIEAYASANTTLRVRRWVNGVSNLLSAFSVPSMGMSSGDWYWIRLRVIGDTVQAKAWRDDLPEPEEWTIEGDALVEEPGYIGISHRNSTLIDEVNFFYATFTDPHFDDIQASSPADASLLGLPGYVNRDNEFTTFEEYDLNQEPEDWSIISGGPSTWEVLERASEPGGKVLRRNASSNSNEFFGWEIAGPLGSANFTTVDLMARIRPNIGGNSTFDRCGLTARARDDGSGVYARFTGSGGSAITISWRRDTGGTTSTSPSFDWTDGEWYWMRLRVVGDTAYAKVWGDGEHEPEEWLGSLHTPDMSPDGFVGLHADRSGQDEWDQFHILEADPSVTDLTPPTIGIASIDGFPGMMQGEANSYTNFTNYELDAHPIGWLDPWPAGKLDLSAGLARDDFDVYDSSSMHQYVRGPHSQTTMAWTIGSWSDRMGLAYRMGGQGYFWLHWSAVESFNLSQTGWALFDNMVEQLVAGVPNPKIVFNHLNSTPTSHEQGFIDHLNANYSNVVAVADGNVRSEAADADLLIVRNDGTSYTEHPESLNDLQLPIVSMNRHTSRIELSIATSGSGTMTDSSWRSRNTRWSVQPDDANALLERGNSTGDPELLTWDIAGVRSGEIMDADVVALVRPGDTSGYRTGIALRVQSQEFGDDADRALVCALISGSSFRIFRLLGSGGFSTITWESGHDWEAGAFYWMRFQVEGGAVRAKFWSVSETEPEDWILEHTSHSTVYESPGRVGVYARESGDDWWGSFDIKSSTPPISDIRFSSVAEMHDEGMMAIMQPMWEMTDFSEYATGEHPNGWVQVWEGEQEWEVVEGGLQGKMLRLDASSSERNALGLEAHSDQIVNAHIMALARGYGLARYGILARAYVWPDAQAGVVAYLGGSTLRVQEYWFDTTSGTSSVSIGHEHGEWYWIRLKVDGGMAFASAWRIDENEPEEWLISRTLNEQPIPGYIGVASPLVSGIREYDRFIVVEVNFVTLRATLGEATDEGIDAQIQE